jgi:hypoxanthine phosphoribosyltransferase
MGSEEAMTTIAATERIRVLLSAEAIRHRIQDLAAELSRDYAGKEPILVCILKGSMVFFVDLARELAIPVRYDYVAVSSYREGTRSSGRPELTMDFTESVEGKHVLLVEDIVDTGLTLTALLDALRARGPASLAVVALLDKPARRRVEVQIDYLGFRIGDEFVVGYGLDWGGKFRNLPYIGVLEEEL